MHEDEAGYEGIVTTDDVSGAQLRPELVAQAREDEIKYFRKVGVFEKVNISQCWIQTSKAPIAVRWVDVNEGYEIH